MVDKKTYSISTLSVFKITFLVFLMISTSCSLKTVYNNLDYLIPAYIDDMVDIDGDLSDLVDLRTTSLLKWHRNDQLPKYLNWLRDIKTLLTTTEARNIKHKQVLYFINNTSYFWADLKDKILKEVAHTLPLLNDEQIDELFEKLLISNDEFISKNISPSKEDKIKIYEERLIDNIKEFFGYLTIDQIKDIKEASSKFQSLSHLILKDRLEWQQKTRKILISKKLFNKPYKLKVLFDRLSIKQNKLHLQIITDNKKYLSSLLYKLFQTLKNDQQLHAIDKLEYYIKLSEGLINKDQI